MPLIPAITLIVPVYNKENYLNKCLASVGRQSINKTELELLLVNDGSTDNSLDICKKFADANAYARVIDKPNGGVSSARNVGILEAKGRYIAFLDADDSLAEGSLKAIVEAFDSMHEEVDLLAYHLVYCYTNTGAATYHKRDKWLKSTGVYKLADYPYICQTTMNIVVKRNPDNQILFDETFKMGEDQHFVTRHLLGKAAIGYCAEAEYRYVRDGGGASSFSNRPIYAYEDMMRLYEFFIKVAEDHPSLTEYSRQILLHNISWRLSSDMLFPTHFSGMDFEQQNGRLTKILKQIPAESYGRSPFIGRWQRAFFFKSYGLLEEDTEISFIGKKTTVSFPSRNFVWKTIAPKISIFRLIQRQNCFELLLRFGCPAFYLNSEVSLEAKIGGVWRNVELRESTYDYWRAHVKTAKFFVAAFKIPFDALVKDSTVFFRSFSSKGEIKRLAVSLSEGVTAWRANCSVSNGSWDFADFSVSALGKELKFEKKFCLDKLKQGFGQRQHDKETCKLRRALKKGLKPFKGKVVWIYADLPTSLNAGNALLQIKHDIAINDEIERYYVSDFPQEVTSKNPELKGRVFACGSWEHKVAMLAAEVLFTSYKEKWIFYPFDKEEWFKIGDLACAKKIIYLQHGILHAHLPWYLGYDRTLFDYIVTSTTTEHKVLTKGYAYPEESLIETGAPRLDKLDPDTGVKKRKIVLIPSWRAYLVSGNAQERIPKNKLFESSNFYKGLLAFLDLVQKGGILEKYGCELDVKLHPNFRCYEQYFKLNIPYVNTLFEGINEAEYAVAITDFSSYVYDFIYSGARVMYFLPDEAEFRGGLNHYRELEIPFGTFGPYSADPTKAAADLEEILASLEAGSPSPYQEKTDSFFLHRDSNACARLYEALSNIEVNY